MPWFNLSDAQVAGLFAGLEEAQRNADSDAKEGVEGAEDSGTAYRDVLECLSAQAEEQDPFEVIRAVVHDTGLSDKPGPLGDIFKIVLREQNDPRGQGARPTVSP